MNTLFHYCSNSTFLSVVSSQSIWLSSLLLSNDSMEGKLLSSVISKLAEGDNLSLAKIQSLQKALISLENGFDGFGFCLSEDGDLLSQWRGYAENGSGMSIGFSKPYIEELSSHHRDAFSLKQVSYEPNEHADILKPLYEDMKEIVNKKYFRGDGSLTIVDYAVDENATAACEQIKESHSAILLKLIHSIGVFFVLKSNAFKEEREWRLIANIFNNSSEEGIFYRVCDKCIIPYRPFKLERLSKNSISHVILGPRNHTPHHVIEGLLKRNGFFDVEVKSSKATYLG